MGVFDTPAGFDEGDETAPWYVGLRRIDRLRIRLDPLLRRTYEGASCVIGIAPYVRDFLGRLPIRWLELMSETGLDSLPSPVDRSDRSGPVRLLFVGRVVRTKGVRDAIRAMAFLSDLSVVLDVVGDGFDRERCEVLVSDLGLDGRVVFHGRKPRDEVDEFYKAADIFVFPSYREAGGNVVFEAMGWCLPLVVSDRGGPGAAVDETCGFRIRPIHPAQYAREIAIAVRLLVMDRALRLSLGNGARQRVIQTALWDQKVNAMGDLYRRILANGGCFRMSDSAPIDVSVLIVNWNTREILRQCLASVFAETHGINFEVIVIDNASSDKSAEMVRGAFPGVRLIANDEERWLCGSQQSGNGDCERAIYVAAQQRYDRSRPGDTEDSYLCRCASGHGSGRLPTC